MEYTSSGFGIMYIGDRTMIKHLSGLPKFVMNQINYHLQTKRVMRILLSVFFICFFLMSYAQMDVIELSNPSFEETPRKGGSINGIKGWYDCGILNFPKESAPDIHPGGFWNVDSEAYDGETYLGLVVRDNDTWESVSQRVYLEEENGSQLLAGNCYSFSMAVHRAEEYISGSRLQLKIDGNKRQIFNYNTPAVVRIFGGGAFCNKKEILATSEPVSNSEWEIIELNFTPEEDHEFITIEAYYNIPILASYNGHVLIDNLSDIIQIVCED